MIKLGIKTIPKGIITIKCQKFLKTKGDRYEKTKPSQSNICHHVSL